MTTSPIKRPQMKIVNSLTINVEEDGKIHFIGPSNDRGEIDYHACLEIMAAGLDVLTKFIKV